MNQTQAGRLLEEHDPCIDLMVAGERLICDWSGCLYWPDQNTLVVSDMHLEKGSSFAARGKLIPPHDTAATLSRLAIRLAVWQPERVICLGDSFHDPVAHERLSQRDGEKLARLMTGREWFWICGNHDPAPPTGLGGTGAREMMLGNLVFRHEPQPGNQVGEIAGHLHPCGKVFRRSKSVRRPCFVTDGTRLILPSFGAYTGGLNLRSEAFSGMFDEAHLSAVLLGRQRVFHISANNLVA
jgi:DNA ligase-associated metallophosphoesterase